MKVYKCDRCGSILEEKPSYSPGEIMLSTSESIFGKADTRIIRHNLVLGTKEIECDYLSCIVDLCPQCIESLGEWFNENFTKEEEYED